jgi:N-acyl-D-amino-acid deacylase
MARFGPVACIALALWALGLAQRPAFDLLIVNGRVLDGSGNPWIRLDIGVREGRIAAVGNLAGQAAVRTIDAQARYVTPGFIDVHSHAREGLEGQLNHAEPLLAQGITTAMLNPDGGGPVDLQAVRQVFERRGTGVHTALFVPHGSIRQQVLGMEDRAPTAAELTRMVELVRAGMQAGGIGLSSGLYYAPGSYAQTDEVIATAKAAG